MQRMRKLSIEELFSATKHTLLSYGYEGFTFTILANYLHVSRGTIYRYFENKEELITTYMIKEMEDVLKKLEQIYQYSDFHDQFDYLLDLMAEKKDIQAILGFSYQIPKSINEKVAENKRLLEAKHQSMYRNLQQFVEFGKETGRFKQNFSNDLILGFIFQTMAIPNHSALPEGEWKASLKKMMSYGICK